MEDPGLQRADHSAPAKLAENISIKTIIINIYSFSNLNNNT